jgi:FkbM family methyltransferase
MGKFFVEVGSCDFDTLVPLAFEGWAGIVTEPVPYLNKKVEHIYGEYPNVYVYPYAINNEDGTAEMTFAKETDDWVRGISSLVGSSGAIHYPENKHLIGDPVHTVESRRLDTWFDEAKVTSIDFMKMDCEGMEYKILEAYSWKIKPSVIKLEHKHIDDIAMKKLLENQGYLVYTEREDIYAIL